MVWNLTGHAVESHVLKTIDNHLNRGLLSLKHLKMFWRTCFYTFLPNKTVQPQIIPIEHNQQKNSELVYQVKQPSVTPPCFPIYDVYQQAVWSIMADVPRIRINSPNVVNFGNIIEHPV